MLRFDSSKHSLTSSEQPDGTGMLASISHSQTTQDCYVPTHFTIIHRHWSKQSLVPRKWTSKIRKNLCGSIYFLTSQPLFKQTIEPFKTGNTRYILKIYLFIRAKYRKESICNNQVFQYLPCKHFEISCKVLWRKHKDTTYFRTLKLSGKRYMTRF